MDAFPFSNKPSNIKVSNSPLVTLYSSLYLLTYNLLRLAISCTSRGKLIFCSFAIWWCYCCENDQAPPSSNIKINFDGMYIFCYNYKASAKRQSGWSCQCKPYYFLWSQSRDTEVTYKVNIGILNIFHSSTKNNDIVNACAIYNYYISG